MKPTQFATLCALIIIAPHASVWVAIIGFLFFAVLSLIVSDEETTQ